MEAYLDLTRCSDQTAHAGPRIYIPHHHPMRITSVPQRGPGGLLRLIPDNAMYDSTFHGDAIYGLRVAVAGDESSQRIRSHHPLCRGWLGRRFRCGHHHPARCYQNPFADPWSKPAGRDSQRPRPSPRCKDHQDTVWLERFHEGLAAQNHHNHAKHCNLLVSTSEPYAGLLTPTQILMWTYRSSYEMAKAYFRRTLREEERARGL